MGYGIYVKNFEGCPIDAIEADQNSKKPPGMFRWKESGVAAALLRC